MSSARCAIQSLPSQLLLTVSAVLSFQAPPFSVIPKHQSPHIVGCHLGQPLLSLGCSTVVPFLTTKFHSRRITSLWYSTGCMLWGPVFEMACICRDPGVVWKAKVNYFVLFKVCCTESLFFNTLWWSLYLKANPKDWPKVSLNEAHIF